MGSDKRVSRTERSGRYGSIIDRDDRDERESRSRRRDSDYKRSSDDRRGDRYDDYRDYDSPERERERRNSDRSEDGYHSDGDYGEHDYRHDISDERESKTIMLRGLPITITESDIREMMESFEGPQPADVRLMKRKTGVSRGFAFVEFYHLQDATSWMEANQKKLVIQGKHIAMHYSNPRPKFEDWLCNKCCLNNFRKRLKCFRCGADKFDSEQEVPSGTTESVQSVDYYCDTIILRNIAPHTVVDSIMTALSPYASLAVNNIRLIKDRQTQQNRGFAFVQLSSAMDASQLLQILQSLHPPLKIDGKTIGVDFAKSARKDLVLPDGNRVSAFSVASTAIAAAQWSSTQPQSGEGGSVDYSYLQPGQDGYAQYAQYSQDYQQCYQQQAGGLEPDAPSASGAAVTTSSAAVVSQSPQLYNQTSNAPSSPTEEAQPSASTGTQAPAAPPTGVVPGTKYAVPDTSTYQYDESSGYYYDPTTGLYYDPNSQYYYNSLTQQYLYWDGEKETYVPAAESGPHPQAGLPPAKEGKEKKEKPKSKTAQQIAKDMERWAKSLNKQKENFKNSFQPVSVSREEERKESAAADAGFALFEKKVTAPGAAGTVAGAFAGRGAHGPLCFPGSPGRAAAAHPGTGAEWGGGEPPQKGPGCCLQRRQRQRGGAGREAGERGGAAGRLEEDGLPALPAPVPQQGRPGAAPAALGPAQAKHGHLPAVPAERAGAGGPGAAGERDEVPGPGRRATGEVRHPGAPGAQAQEAAGRGHCELRAAHQRRHRPQQHRQQDAAGHGLAGRLGLGEEVSRHHRPHRGSSPAKGSWPGRQGQRVRTVWCRLLQRCRPEGHVRPVHGDGVRLRERGRGAAAAPKAQRAGPRLSPSCPVSEGTLVLLRSQGEPRRSARLPAARSSLQGCRVSAFLPALPEDTWAGRGTWAFPPRRA
ncbi:RNA binding motif protein 5 [Phyllostomus discolor]|uniref:RNA-binding protein 5 n=14 Tax=Boreoeutheria TaxID=1437010 RepID=A0A834E254_9CHIR|nr:RNA binding motif protein 5 [Phyllostomus discolor]